jgi:hypothetical protein
MRNLLTLVFLVGLSPFSAAEEPKFDALAEDYEAKAKIVERLDTIMLKDVRIEDLDIGEAVHLLQGLGSGDDSHRGVINLFIRAPGRHGPAESGDAFDPFAPAPTEPKEPDEPERPNEPVKVSLIAASISFAEAIDKICTQAGYRWEIGGDRRRYPILIITPNPE